jgi:hypothetical protein
MADTTDPRDGLAGKLKRTELQRAASSITDREIVQVLTEIPEGVESGWHMHPGEEVGRRTGEIRQHSLELHSARFSLPRIEPIAEVGRPWDRYAIIQK